MIFPDENDKNHANTQCFRHILHALMALEGVDISKYDLLSIMIRLCERIPDHVRYLELGVGDDLAVLDINRLISVMRKGGGV
jgi:hypothetical protein